MKKMIILILCLVPFSNAFASYQFALEASYIKRTANYTIGSSETQSEETRIPMEFKIGKVLRNKVYLGGVYNMGTRNITSGTTTTKQKQKAYGVTLGYDTERVYYHLSYYLSAELDLDNDVVFKKGSGIQADVGWKLKIRRSLYLIPQISYRKFSYKEKESAGAVTNIKSSEYGEIIPEVGLMYEYE